MNYSLFPPIIIILRVSAKETGGERRKIGRERREGSGRQRWRLGGRGTSERESRAPFIDQRRRLLLFRREADGAPTDRLRAAHTRPHKVSFHPFAYFCMINGGRF
jgi:hypothetical protein